MPAELGTALDQRSGVREGRSPQNSGSKTERDGVCFSQNELIIPPVTIKEPPKTTGTVAGWLNPILATTCAPNADRFLSDYRSDAAGE